jgi:hypothetical protein
MNIPVRAELHGRNARALTACGLWSGAGFIGASALGAVLAQGIQGGVAPALALVVGTVGGLLAGYAWRRARIALEHADVPPWSIVGEGVATARLASAPTV